MNKAIPEINVGDDFRWFVGTVVEHVAPRGYEGRVQIRIRGIHPIRTDDVPQAALPWAQVLVPGTEEGSSGLGKIPKLTTGATVWGFFLDGKSSQVPVVVGSFTKTESETPIQGFKKQDLANFTATVAGNDKNYSYIDSVEEVFAELRSTSREITEVVVHWTQSYNNKDLSAEDINTVSGSIGFHYVIRRDGTLQRGLPVNQTGNHTTVASHNQRSIGLAFVGGLNVPNQVPNPIDQQDVRSLTRSQLNTFYWFMSAYFRAYPNGQALGARDLETDNDGPGFDVRSYCKDVFGKDTLFYRNRYPTLVTRTPFTQKELAATNPSAAIQAIEILPEAQAYLAPPAEYAVTTDKIERGVLDLIADYESNGSYIAVFPSSTQSNLTTLTLTELDADMLTRINNVGGSASGRYQIIRDTLLDTSGPAVRQNLSFGTTVFNEATQDSLALWLLYNRGTVNQRLQNWIDGTATNRQFLFSIAGTWAAFPDPDTGFSRYGGVGNNQALITVDVALNHLENIRTGGTYVLRKDREEDDWGVG